MTVDRKSRDASSLCAQAAERAAGVHSARHQSSAEERIFLTAYVLWLTASVLDITMWRSVGLMPQVIDYVQNTGYILLIIQFLLKRTYGKKDAAGIFLILFGCILAEHSIYSRQIIPVVFFVYFSADVRFDKILKCTLAVQAAILVITAAASGLGIIEDVLWYEGDRVRHSLGYTYCGYPAHLVLFMTMIWLCIRRRAYIADACVLLFLNYLVYCFTDSRTDFMLSVLGVAGAFLCPDWHRKIPHPASQRPRSDSRRSHTWDAGANWSGSQAAKEDLSCSEQRRPRSQDAQGSGLAGMASSFRIMLTGSRDFLLGVLARYGYFLAFAVSLIAHTIYNQENAFQFRLNEALNGRLQFGHTAILNYGFSLFGKAIRWFGQGSLRADASRTYNYVDNSFLKELLSYGWIFSILLIVGFYLTGKLLARKKEWMLCWAMLVSLAYAILNAHLLVLTFNVFILLPGKLFAKEENFAPAPVSAEPVKEGAAARAKTMIPAEAVSAGMKSAKRMTKQASAADGRRADLCRRVLRCGLFIGILCDTIVVQNMSASDQLQYARMHIWIICAMLFAIIVLCAQESVSRDEPSSPDKPCAQDAKTRRSNRSPQRFVPHVRCSPDLLRLLLILFLALACISDFFVSKKFRYAAFAMLAFGGMFLAAWKRMRRPERLLEEYKLAWKLLFAAAVIYCMLARPAVPGIHYTGMYTDSIAFGCFALIALVVFLSDQISDQTANQISDYETSALWSPRNICNGIAAAVALYFIWMTQELTMAAAAALTMCVFVIYWLRTWMRAKSGKERIRQVLNLVIAAAMGAVLVLAVRAAIYYAAFALGTRVVYENDQAVQITESVPALLSGGGWKDVLLSRWENARAYLENLNLIGNKNRLRIDGKMQWAQNSILMTAYRYGIPAGIAYAGMLVTFLWSAVATGFRKNHFFIAGGAVACITVCMLEAVELPFIRLIWLAFYFVAGCTMQVGGQIGGMKNNLKRNARFY